MQVEPTNQDSRINQLDILRGFALMGILIMNIQSFSMPLAAYLNPTVWGDLKGINYFVWFTSHILADAKFMGLFSILFGAGICLFAERAEQRNGRSGLLHYKRNFWLLVFGLIHAHFIWFGDILVSYALCGFWVYWFRHKSVKFLITSSILFLSILFFYTLLVNFAINNQFIPQESIEEILYFWRPDHAQLAAEISAYTGGFLEQTLRRSSDAFFLETQGFFGGTLWRVGGMMLLGMALYKNGVLTGKRTNTFYFWLILVGLSIGISLSSYGIIQNFLHGFDVNYSMFLGSQFNYWGSIFTTLAYIGMINLVINNGLLKSLQKRLAAVGQMAFSNYIAHSLICTFIFYGHGLGLFSQVERSSQIIIVFVIWGLQLWYSPLWLNKYRFGPLEWMWRSLTYWQKQSMVRPEEALPK